MSKKLAMNTTVDGETYKAGSVPPAEVAKKITNPKAWGSDAASAPAPEPAPADPPAGDPDSGSGPADPDSDGGPDYDGMSPDELRAEAERRELKVKGTGSNGNVKKVDLVKALKAHDAAASE